MTSGRLASRIDIATNILTIIVALIFIGLVVQRYLLSTKSTLGSPTIGRSVAIDGFDPSEKSKNVLLVMMKGCRFCEASMGFYKEVQRKSKMADFKVVAVFPPSTDSVESYLAEHGLEGIQIVYSQLAEIEVDGTPTMIVTDQNGKITKTWVGQLSNDREIEVVDFLGS